MVKQNKVAFSDANALTLLHHSHHVDELYYKLWHQYNFFDHCDKNFKLIVIDHSMICPVNAYF